MSPGSARSPDLVATIAATSCAIGIALFVDSGPLAVAALLPLVLVLPGYALTALLFPPGSIDRDFRIVLTVALSIGVTALSGLFLQVFVSLGRGVVAASLAAITIGAALAAMRERAERGSEVGPSSGPLPRLLAPSGVAILAAIAISGIAIAIASDGANRQLGDSHFSSLWLVPVGAPGVPPNGPPVIVGVANEEGRETGYSLMLTEGPSTIGAWHFRLAPDEEWEKTLPASELQGSGRLLARLSRNGLTYRRVAVKLDFRSEGVAGG